MNTLVWNIMDNASVVLLSPVSKQTNLCVPIHVSQLEADFDYSYVLVLDS